MVLTGVHLGGYGEDLDPKLELSDLLEMMAEQVPLVIKRRAQALRQLGQRKRAEFARGFIGREAQVLVEQNPAAAGGYVTGYSRNYQPVEFAGHAEMVNREVAVRIVGWQRDKLVGQMLGAAPA